MRGPKESGLVMGRAAPVEAIRAHASPHQRLARAMKVGKEEMMGLLAAVRWYLGQDHAAVAERYEAVVVGWVDALGRHPGVAARRDLPGEAGQPVPRALVTLDPSLRFDSAAVQAALLAGEPPVDVSVAGRHGFYLNPEWLEPGEDDVVAARVSAAIRALCERSGQVGR
jgi:seryl-tRNA(Sec) selenium transferase